MTYHSTVTLSSNGKYWQAFYYDSTGKRRAKSLGPKGKLSKRQAKVLCDRLAAELCLNPGKASAGRPLKLAEFMKRYLESRTDLRSTTLELHRLTTDYLVTFFDGDARIERITRAMAADWRLALAKGQLSFHRNGRTMTEASVCLHVRNAKTIFNHAVRDDLILFNPFGRLKGVAPAPAKDWKYLSLDEFRLLIDSCPSRGWRLLIALCRLAGLRRGEALDLSWSMVDWKAHRITILAQKTSQRRTVPVVPELYEMLLAGFEAAKEGQELVCPVSHHGLWRNFQVIRQRAGLAKWKDAFQVMRRNCETDWAQKYPQYVVSTWIGHDITVSARHYLQVPDQLYEAAAGTKRPGTATRTATKRKPRAGMRS